MPDPRLEDRQRTRVCCEDCGGFGVHGVLDIEVKCRDCDGRGYTWGPSLDDVCPFSEADPGCSRCHGSGRLVTHSTTMGSTIPALSWCSCRLQREENQ